MTQTVHDRLERLRLANEIRSRRAALKRHLGGGTISLSWVLRANKGYVQTMRIAALLQATPRIGQTKAQRALKAVGISPTARLRSISMVRREALIKWLSEHYPAVRV